MEQVVLTLSVVEFVGGAPDAVREQFTYPVPIVVELAGETYQLYGHRPFLDVEEVTP